MSEYDIKAVQLGVRSSNPSLPRHWTNMLVSLTANGIQYSPTANPEKVALLIDLAGIDSIGNYDSGKSEPAFQVKWKGSTTLHKCADADTVESWVYKVMSAKMGPSKTSDTESSEDSEEEEVSSGEEEEASRSSPEVPAKKLAKSEDKSKKAKSKDKKEKLKSKTAEPPKKKSKKDKEKKSKPSTAGKENGKDKKGADSPSAKRSKSETGTDSYVPQFMAHYNGLKQQERQKYFEGLSTQDLVKLVSGGLEAEVKENREQILKEWASSKKAKLLELHELEQAELQKKHQRELDDVPKRMKEFMEQTV